MGILGGSFGGYETNCLIGRSDIFAAAYSVAGWSNLTSLVGFEDRNITQRQYWSSVPNGQTNLGVNLWERPDLYVANSPIFYADRVKCPVLIWHGRQDPVVPIEQSIELYRSLQANGKKVWLDAVSGAGHAAAGIGSLNDIKVKQFFGHYLKDEPAPYWMTRSVLEILEKALNPYAYDFEIKTPGDGIIPKEKSYTPPVQKLLSQRTTVDSNGRIINIEIK